MKAASPATIALLAGNQFYMADLYTVTLQDGTVLRYTDADGDLFAPVLGSLVQSGVAQAATSQSLTLSTSADVVADAYKKKVVRLTSGAGAVQERNVVTSRKNGLRYSQSFANAVHNKVNSSISENVAIAPDGTLTADKLIESTAATTYHYLQLDLYSFVAGVPCTQSIYLKAGERTTGYLQMPSAAPPYPTVNFNLTNGTITGSSGGAVGAITSVGNGWYRVSITATPTITASARNVVVLQNTTYTGDGVSGYYLWGSQFEDGSSASEYIHTEASAAVGVAVDAEWLSNDYAYSEDFSNAYWGKNNVTVVSNATTAPDGSMTADKVVSNVFTGRLAINKPLTAVANIKYTAQYSLKAGEFNVVTLFFDNTACAEGAYYGYLVTLNLSTGVSSNTSIVSLESEGDGWWRATMTATPTTAATYFEVAVNNSGGVNNAIGDGVKGFYIWGGQRTVGAVKTPYIATTTAAILPPDATSTYDLLECQYASTSPKIVRDRTKSVVGIEVDSMNVTLYAGVQDMINGIPFPQFVANGGFDGARVKVDRCFMPSYGDTSAGVVNIFTGRVSDVKPSRTEIQLSVTSDLELLNAPMPRNVYSPACSHNLFDSGCGASKAAFSAATACATGTTNLVINCSLAQAAGHFDAGTITFNSGQNAGASRTVKSYTPGVFVLSLPLPFVPAVGDAFTAYAGCDKSQATCNSKFNRLASFRGFPFIPVPEASI